MNELNKEAFASFILEQRKAKGYTQKDLADILYVSDKAVSKWERGLSMPDVSLLLPLSNALDVSVTELLEGRKFEVLNEQTNAHVEELVKKVLEFSDETPEKKKQMRRKNAGIFLGFSIIAFIESAFGIILGLRFTGNWFSWGFWTEMALSFMFGIYFWLFMKRHLPLYYDANKISVYNDGFFNLCVPGAYLNNKNWPVIVGSLQKWSIITLLFMPVCYTLLTVLNLGEGITLGIDIGIVSLYLITLFVPVYKYGRA